MLSDQRLRKTERLRRHVDIKRVRQGEKFKAGPFLISICRRSEGLGPRLVIAIKKSSGGSVIRNRAKRRVREFFRKNKQSLGNFDYFFFSSRPLGGLEKDDWQKIGQFVLQYCNKRK